MRIPPVNTLGRFLVPKSGKVSQTLPPDPPLKKDTVSFSASTAYYLKKYNTLPDEIKKILTPKDAIDMFKDMEMIQRGILKGKKVGQGNHANVYENPWLDGYYVLISKEGRSTRQTVYSRYNLGDSIWSDRDNELIQIIKKAS